TVPACGGQPRPAPSAQSRVQVLLPARNFLPSTKGPRNRAGGCCGRWRAKNSPAPPAANGTTMVTGRCGQASCACAGAASATTAATARTRRMCKSPGLTRWRSSHRLEMGIAALVEVLVGVAHGLGLAASEHDLEIDRLEAVVLI